MDACGITVNPYTTPLGLYSPTPFNWWMCNSTDLITWEEPWVMSIFVKFPPARLNSDYSTVQTLSGSAYQTNLASEGFSINSEYFTLIFNTATEQVFTDDAHPSYKLPPVYGREVTLKTTYPSGQLIKNTYISTKDSSGNSDCWLLLQLRFTPGQPSMLEIWGNGVFLMSAPMTISNLMDLVLADFQFTPTPISDTYGEINDTLAPEWPVGATLPPPVIQHLVVGYPHSYVGYSQTLGFIDIARDTAILPTFNYPVDPTVMTFIGAPWVSFNDGQGNPLAFLNAPVNISTPVYAKSLSPDSGSCVLWLDTPTGSVSLGSSVMSQGSVGFMITPSTLGSGWLRVENKGFGVSGFSYMTTNPLPCFIT